MASPTAATADRASWRESSEGESGPGAVNQHDREEQQHENAAGVHEDLGKRQEPEPEQSEQARHAEQERAQPERHAHHVSAEGDGGRADESDSPKDPRRARSSRHLRG